MAYPVLKRYSRRKLLDLSARFTNHGNSPNIDFSLCPRCRLIGFAAVFGRGQAIPGIRDLARERPGAQYHLPNFSNGVLCKYPFTVVTFTSGNFELSNSLGKVVCPLIE